MSAVDLGATLYVPATREGAARVAYGSCPDLRSMVICLEDAVSEAEIDEARERFCDLLRQFKATPPPVRVYARPRSPDMLSWMLKQDGIAAIDGFVLPKVTTASLPFWLSVLVHSAHSFMPTVETEEAFDRNALERMRDQLLPYAERVKAIRIGGNDILNILGVRRSRERTAYEGPLGDVIRAIALTFIPYGFAVSAPVFEHYGSPKVLQREVEQDIEHGLLTKTAIHPIQLALIHSCYRPAATEMAEARQVLDREARAVFGTNGSMCEPATHRRWAGTVIERAQVYGVRLEINNLNSHVA